MGSTSFSRSWRRVRGKRWKALRGRLGELSDRARAARRLAPPVARAEAPGAEHEAAVTNEGGAATSGAPTDLASEPQARLMKH